MSYSERELVPIRGPYTLDNLNLANAKCDGCEGPMVGKLRDYSYGIGIYRFESTEVPALSCLTDREPECGGDYYPGEISVAMVRQVVMGLQLKGEQKLAYQVQLTHKGLTTALAIKGSGLVKPTSPR